MLPIKKYVYCDTASTTNIFPQLARHIYNLSLERKTNIYRSNVGYVTAQYNKGRSALASLFNCREKNLYFCANATYALNQVAYGLPISDGVVVTTDLEHSSNILPWLYHSSSKNLKVQYVKTLVNATAFAQLDISSEVKAVCINMVSHVTGRMLNVRKIVQTIKRRSPSTLVIVDGTQAPLHTPIDIKQMQCDIFVCSLHKFHGPDGIGLLFVNEGVTLKPFVVGGGSITENNQWVTGARLYESGTPNITSIMSLPKFCELIREHVWTGENNKNLLYIEEALRSIKGLNIVGDTHERHAPIFSFYLDDLSSYDIGYLLGQHGVVCRTGTLCAPLLFSLYNYSPLVRLSFHPHSTIEEVDYVIQSLLSSIKMLRKLK